MAKFADTKGLSKQEKFMVLGMLVDNTTSVEDIAKYLDRDLELIESFVQSQTVQETQTVEPEKTEAVVQPPQVQHIINKTGKGQSGVAIMTSTASERSDASKKGRGIHTSKNSQYTHKIK